MLKQKLIKRKATKKGKKQLTIKNKEPAKSNTHNEEISSDSDLEDIVDNKIYESSESEQETAQEKRLKLAKKYLSELEVEEKNASENKEFDSNVITQRLRHDVLEKAGTLQRTVADSYEAPDSVFFKVHRGHKLPLTCIVISNDEKYMYSSSKDSAIIKWDFIEGKKLKTIPGLKPDSNEDGHSGQVLCLALSTDGKYLTSGDTKKNIHVWEAETMKRVKSFTGHRDGVTSLAFRKGTHQLFSASTDRSVKVWNLDEMAYVETLFGHQDSITSIDSMLKDRAITSGGRDGTIRLWKIPEESQLIFTGTPGASIDVVRMINEQHFVTGSDNGAISLWGLLKKKPLVTVQQAHGMQDESNPYWITSITVFPNTDLIASGSHNGEITLWKCGEGFKTLTKKFSIPVIGFVNVLEFSRTGSHLVAGIGQEHKLGRWWRLKEAKNSIVVIPLKLN